MMRLESLLSLVSTPYETAKSKVRKFASQELKRLSAYPGTVDAGSLIRGIPRSNTSRQGVNETVAQQLTAVKACIEYRSSMIGIMPWHVMERLPDGTSRIALEHPLERVFFKEPNKEMPPNAFKRAIVGQLVGWGNGYAHIMRDRAGRITGLYPIESYRVHPYRDAQTLEILYDVHGCHDGTRTYEARDIFHVHENSLNGVMGRSSLLIGTQPIGNALAADRFAGSYFGNYAKPVGYLTFSKFIEEEVRDQMREEWYQLYGAGDGMTDAQQIAILGEDGKFVELSVDPSAMQALETRQFNILEICRLLRTPPQKVYEYQQQGATASAEINSTTVNETLMPDIVGLEEQANFKMIGEPRFYTNIDPGALLRGTPTERWQNYRIGKMLGVYSTNDINRREGLPGIGPAGDVRWAPLNMTTDENFASSEFQAGNASAAASGNENDSVQEGQDNAEENQQQVS